MIPTARCPRCWSETFRTHLTRTCHRTGDVRIGEHYCCPVSCALLWPEDSRALAEETEALGTFPAPLPARALFAEEVRVIVYISIGNSDDKLSQADWSSYVRDVDRAFDASVGYEGARVHGRWYSLPMEPWQNACWCAEWHEDLAHVAEALKRKLASIARTYRQDSITWAVAETEFLRPEERSR